MSQQRYEVKGKIGHGGLGEVYLAQDTQLDREVALKRMKPPEDGNMEALSEDLFREAKTLSVLQHPNIVTVYDVGRDEKGPFLVLEFLKGETLDAVIDRGGMTLDDFRQVVVQTLEGLVAAQSVGLVHRDLKPGNLMVIWLPTGKFQIKILDFGLAKFSQKARVQTQDHEGGIFGSIFFMAPEQFERLPLDSRTDMYSLGCIYYQILTTKHPFGGETAVEVMASHLQHHVAPLRQLRPDLPEWLCHWVMWLISREMDDRPPDARIALEFFQTERHGLKGVPVSQPVAARPAPGQGPVRVMRPGGTTRQIVPGQPATPSGVWQGPPPVAGSASQQLRAGTVATSRSSMPAVQRLPRRSRKSLWIALASAGVLLAAGAVWFFFFSTPGENPKTLLENLAKEASPEGTPQIVSKLAKFIRDGAPEAKQASDILKKLSGPDVGDAVLSELEKSTTASARILFLEALAEQTATPKRAVPVLIKMATDNAGAVREAAFRALPAQARPEEVPLLLKGMPALKDDGVRLLDAVDAALDLEKDTKAREKVMLAALRDAPPVARQRFHQMLGKIDSQEARTALRNDITSADKAIQEAALRATPAWPPHGSVASSILQAVQKGANRDLAMQVYCDIALRMDTVGSDRVGMLKRAEKEVPAAVRPAWVKALASIADPAAADYAKSLNEKEAAEAIAKLLASRTSVDGPKTRLPADKAVILGKEDASYSSVTKTISGWKDPDTKVAWDVDVKAAGTYVIHVAHSSNIRKPRTFRIVFGEATAPIPVLTTAGTDQFDTIEAGPLTIPKPGSYRIWVEPVTMERGVFLMNLKELEIQKK